MCIPYVLLRDSSVFLRILAYSDVFWHILVYSGVLEDLPQKVPKRVLGGPEPHKCHYLTFSVEEINTLKEAIETLKNGVLAYSFVFGVFLCIFV